jgi:hypothetical protein
MGSAPRLYSEHELDNLTGLTDRFLDTQIVTAMQQLVIKSMCYLKRKTRLRSNKYGQLLIPTQRILLCFLSNEDVATTMREVSQSLTLAQVGRRIWREAVSRKTAKEKSRQLAASLREEKGPPWHKTSGGQNSL